MVSLPGVTRNIPIQFAAYVYYIDRFALIFREAKKKIELIFVRIFTYN